MKKFSLFEKDRIECKPFIKWVGGKGQLLSEINKLYPVELGKNINKYAEIFVGGGAVLFDILSKYKLDEVYISDKNLELINTYKSIRDDVGILIKLLKEMEEQYIPLDNENRKDYYYKKREEYNSLKINSEVNNIEKAVLFIFLNKTCFNGLYRVNKKGAKIVISNSDPKNNNIDDNFFDKLYKNYNINRVKATRMLNSNASLRRVINELLITNYK
ncbi:DNA adenine methylase [Fusobacterium nucleatum]|uniref:DNA adenine methylase n=1 Tax=Fusobacterium nucleatum TaxID=851 RepID=UPI00235E8131|nr:Dam family site-specific DNA-(adenine-N6)-methyltransferase [Fusobacterium nucleatum]WDA45409.1 Dam family site-specific DNA-(adenine-N6)-methyltransferase [Fusobacterium nucleatum]